MAGDEATNTIAKPSLFVAEVVRVPTDTSVDLMDLVVISPSQVEIAADDTPVPEVDVGTQLVHTSLPVIVTVEIGDGSPSRDLQVMEDGDGEILPIPFVRELKDPNPIKVIPAEGNSFLSLFFKKTFTYIFRNAKCK